MLRKLTAVAVVLISAACSQNLNPGTPEYIQDQNAHTYMMAANVGAVEEAELALERSANLDVRNFAQRMIDDHSRSATEHADMGREFNRDWDVPTRHNPVTINGMPAPVPTLDVKEIDRDELVKNADAAELYNAHNTALAELRKLDGAAFDRAFISREIAVHRDILAKLDAMLPGVTTVRLHNQLERDRNAIAAHLRAAERLDP